MSEKRPALPALTGLRVLAAAYVLVLHITVDLAPGVLPLPAALRAITARGAIGVQLFFVLSGFILAYVYLSPSRTLCGTPKQFYLARIARIYPLYLAILLLNVLPYAWHAWTFRSSLAAPLSLLCLETWLPWADFSWPQAGWSIGVEACFYALFPFLGPAFIRVPRAVIWRRLIVCWGGTAMVACLGLLVKSTDLQWAVIVNPALHLPEFGMGVLTCAIFLQPKTRPAPHWYSGAALGCLLAALVMAAQLPEVVCRAGLLDPLFCAALYCLAQARAGRFVALLRTRTMVLLGEASYALYLVHWPLWTILIHYAPGVRSRPGVLDYVALCFCSALVLHLFLERPARHWLRRACADHARTSLTTI